jgi:hypothetical protein
MQRKIILMHGPLYKENVETLQRKIPCSVRVKHIYRVPEGILKKKMHDYQYI